MTAPEARKISDENKLLTWQVHKLIELAAKDGCNSVTIQTERLSTPDATESWLIMEGYDVDSDKKFFTIKF